MTKQVFRGLVKENVNFYESEVQKTNMNVTQIVCHITKYILKFGIYTQTNYLIKSETNNIVGQLYFNEKMWFKNRVLS